MIIENNSKVSLEYTMRLQDGTVLDTATKDDPIRFRMGDQEVFPAVETALMQRKMGDRFEFTVPFAEAFGAHNEDLVKRFPRNAFDDNAEFVEGEMYEAETEDGVPVAFIVTKLLENELEADFNHPLAGQDLVFAVHVLEISQ